MDTPQVLQQAAAIIPSPSKKLSPKVLILIGTILIIGISLTTYLVLSRQGKAPRLFAPQPPKVALQTTYENPFDKETQFVNPFQENKNPFRNIY